MSATSDHVTRFTAELTATLHEREALLRAISESTTELIFVKDRQGRLLYANPAMLKAIGMPPEAAIGSDVAARCRVAGEAAAMAANDRRVMESGASQVFEETFTGADGTGTYLSTKSPLRDAAGAVIGVVGVSRDISDRKRIETALRRSHDTFFNLVENSPFGLYIVDAQFRLRQVSAGAQKVFAEVRPLIGRDFAEVLRLLWPEPFATEAIARFRHTLATGERFHSVDTTERRHDSGELESYDWQLDRITLPSGEFGVACYFYDLTERKRAERRIDELHANLRGRLEELETLMNVLPVAVFVAHDAACSRIAANPAGAAALRIAPGTNASLDAPGADALPFRFRRDGALIPLGALPMHRAARSGEAVLGEELDIVFADGTVTTHQAYAMPLFEAGRVRGCLGVFVDITERKRTEEALRESDRRKDEFLATLSHELRNPLAPLRNSVYLLRRRIAPDAAAQVHAMMERQVDQLVRLVDDLMEVSRITRGTLELRRQPLALEAALRNAIETADPLIRSGDHRLHLQLPREPLTIDADPVRIGQVFANLLNNAAKYTDRGGTIAVEARREGGEAVVTVTDTGQGIEPHEMPLIFRMFGRTARSSRRTQGGLGIGLALVQKLVEMHGGSVAAHSEGRGRGSRFTVRLPLDRSAEPRGAAVATTDHAAVARVRVLVVDDNGDAADSLAMLLGELGAEVRVARDGAAALAAYEVFRPRVVLLDIGMPDMDGYTVAQHLRSRADAAGPGVEIVAVTGWGQDEDKARARAAGFDQHLVKPPQIEQLRALLAAAAARR